MTDADCGAAVALLSRGFRERSPEYWKRALERLRDRKVPDGYTRYGYVIADRGAIVGIILLIFSAADDGSIRGNVSSWYVEPAYRGYANMLLATLSRLKDVTLFNISPAPNTIDTIAAQGFSRYVAGSFHTLACLHAPIKGARVRAVTAAEASFLGSLAAYGCLCFEVTLCGHAYPFAFVRSRMLGNTVPCTLLVYCRDIGDFARFAGPLGRRLLVLGLAIVTLDANGPIDGLLGRYVPGRRPKYFRGPQQPRLGDLSESELVIFGP